MAQCPKCNSPVTVDFGIYTCGVCDSVLFIDINGNVQLEGEGAVASEPAVPPPALGVEVPEPPNPVGDLMPPIPPAPNASAPSNDVNDGPVPLPDPPPEILSPPLSTPASSDLTDIAKFGNSEASLVKEGPYIYDVLIWNIDSKELKENFRMAIADKRFGWDADSIISSIKQGAVRISKVNAVKAAILIHRIKNLPLGISWEQKIYTDTSS